MTDRRPEGTAYTGERGTDPPVPKDPPDQQIQEGEDPLDVPIPKRVERQLNDSGHQAPDVPEPDESGAGRADREQPEGVEPEEPSG